MIDPEEIDNTVNVFKNQEFRVIEITKTVLKNPLIEIFHQNQYIVKPSVVPNQKIVIQNRSYPPSPENPATVQNLIVQSNHPNLLLIQDYLKNYY